MHSLLFMTYVIFAYILGSLCMAIFVCKLFRLPDPRLHGSNNPGTTNVMRLGGKLPALITLLGDAMKGIIPILLAKATNFDNLEQAIILIAAVLGHIFPVFFKFKGGKAIATTIGGLLFFNVIIGASFIVIWLPVAFITRISSLAAISAIIALPFISYGVLGLSYTLLPLIFLTTLVLWTHRSNINRLLSGTEPRVKKHKI